MKGCRKKLIRTAAVLLCFLGIIAATCFRYMEEQGNFHPITSGEAYRSAQLDQDELEYYIRKFEIRSIINLRGQGLGEPWYEEEIATCRELGVKHYDFRLSAGRAPSSREIEDLLRLFRIAPRSVLIHCQGGADRSGLAAAIWQVVIDGKPKPEAEKQLSFVYGHIPFGPTQALDEFFEKWVIPTKASYGGSVSRGRIRKRWER